MKVVVTERARFDLQEICDFIATDNSTAALKVLGEFRDAIVRLAEYPESGHRRRDVTSADVRFITIYHYHVVYRMRNGVLEIITILSGYRDLKRLLPEQ